MTDKDDSITKCSQWLDGLNIEENDETASCSSEVSSSTNITASSENSAMNSGLQFMTNDTTIGTYLVNNNTKLILSTSNLPESANIQIYKSKKVHIGDVNYIQGPVYIKQNENTYTKGKKVSPPDKQVPFRIIERKFWLAQPPVEVRSMETPAKHVIIIHSAAEEADTLAENTLQVRLIQSFHMDSRRWNDIAYNFLIGGDGSVFEGRGWNVVGSHTQFYNTISVGICFIGTFIRRKPSLNALRSAKQLIEHGVTIGAIQEDYSILGHCQCIGTESPGAALFGELKSWKNFDSTVSLKNPSFALPYLRNQNDFVLP